MKLFYESNQNQKEHQQVCQDNQDLKTKTEERTGRNIVAKGDKDFYFETLCKYKNNDGSIGVILQVKEKKNEKIQGT